MNSDVQRFLNRNGINPMEMSQSENGRIKSPMEVNQIVAKYNFYKQAEVKEISIADIEGYDYQWCGINPHIAYSMDSFFDSFGDGYHSRSVGLLDYTADNVMNQINFREEPIVVDEMGDNKYVISTNGLHRYTVLRVLYLSEYMQARGNEREIERLKEKYTIPAKVRELEEFKTYSKYLLISSQCGVNDVEKEYDNDTWTYTGRLVIRKKNEEKIIIESDEQLLEYVNSQADIINQNIENLQSDYDKYPSFRAFLEKYYAGILNIEKLKEKFIACNEIEKGDLELW